nr:ribonuclease H-like domain-containing protein [Tanacetum cinerariifolium]
MTNYSLWEVILNGNSPTPTRIVDGVVQVIAPTTAEQRLAKKNEMKVRGTLLMALTDKHQLKFNIHKDAKSLMEATEKRFRGNKEIKKRNKADLEEQSLDDLFNNLKIYEAEIKSSSPTSHNTQNIVFVSSNNIDSTIELVSVVPSVSAASFKALVSTLSNLDKEDLKKFNADDLEEMDLKWQMAMLTMRARRFLQRTKKNLGENGTTAIGFDMSKVECYNCHRRGHFYRECRSPRKNKNKDTSRRTVLVEASTSNALVSQCDGVGSYDWSFQADKEPTNYAVMAFTSSGSSSSSGSDNEVAPCFKACSKPYATLQSHYDKLTVDFRKSQFDILSYKSSLESVEARLVVYQQNENVFEEDIKLLKLDVMLRDNALVELRKKFKKAEQERDEFKHTLEKFQTYSKNLSKLLESQITNKTGLGYANQVFNSQVFDGDELTSSESDKSVPTSPVTDSETVPNVAHFKSSTIKTSKKMSKTLRPDAPIIEDWTSNFEEEYEPESGNPQQALKDKGVIDSGCLRHMTGNIAYLSDCEEINGGYVAFGGNPKGGKLTSKGKIKTCKLDFDDVYFVKELKFNLFSVSKMCDKKNNVLFTDTECVVLSSDFKLHDENHVLLRVPRENNMYNVDLKNVVPLGDLTCLFPKVTLDESNLLAVKLVKCWSFNIIELCISYEN